MEESEDKAECITMFNPCSESRGDARVWIFYLLITITDIHTWMEYNDPWVHGTDFFFFTSYYIVIFLIHRFGLMVELHSLFSFLFCISWFVQALCEYQSSSCSHTGEGKSMIHECTQERAKIVFVLKNSAKILISVTEIWI